MISVAARGRFASVDICDASTAAEKRFKDRLGLWHSVTKSRASGVEDLRRRLIICLARGWM